MIFDFDPDDFGDDTVERCCPQCPLCEVCHVRFKFHCQALEHSMKLQHSVQLGSALTRNHCCGCSGCNQWYKINADERE